MSLNEDSTARPHCARMRVAKSLYKYANTHNIYELCIDFEMNKS